MSLLTGKVILVVGASSGIGADAARVFASDGASLMLVARTEEPLAKLASELSDHDVAYTTGDVSSAGHASVETLTGSVAGLLGMPQHFAYCAAKAGVIHLTKSLALDHGRENIRINCICPGGVLTPMLGEVININDPMQVERVAKQHALGRVAEPEEIARVSLFLCSKDASFMTGAAVTVDGGIAAGRMGQMHSR